MKIISAENITKHFGSVTALDNVSIEVRQGEIYSFLGLNGAGKTTLIRILLGMIKADSGSITLFGKPLNTYFAQWNDVGYMVETPHSYPNLSVVENLKVYYELRRLNNRRLITGILEKLKLERYADVKAKHLSLGNRQRLGLAKALMHQPKLLILDEPINGLDPEGITEVRDLLRELAAAGSTIFLSSHILSEVSRLANRVAIIHLGGLVQELTTASLNASLIKKVMVKTNDNPAALALLADYSAVLKGDEIEVTGEEAIAKPETISQLLADKGLPPRQIYLCAEDLESYFLRTIRNARANGSVEG